MLPEATAREQTAQMLEASGWRVQDRQEVNLHAGCGVAVRELSFKCGHGEADYLLFADGKAIATVQAKPVGHTLHGVEEQSAKYGASLPDQLPFRRKPLPFAYESTGDGTSFWLFTTKQSLVTWAKHTLWNDWVSPEFPRPSGRRTTFGDSVGMAGLFDL